MKKLLSLVLAVVMIMSIMAGMTFAAADEPITLRFWGGVQPEYGYDAVQDTFNEQFKDKGIQVEYVRYVNNDDGNLQLDTYLMAGGEIDIFMGYGGTGRLYPRVDSGLILNMTDYFAAAGFDPVAELGEAAVAQFKYKDSWYAVPTKYENQLYWFANVQMFEEAGIELPFGGWTYSEFLDACEKLTHGEGMDKVYGIYWATKPFNDVTRNFILTLSEYGFYTDVTCNESNFNSDVVVDTLDLMATTQANGWAPTYEEEVADNLSLPTVFLEGKSAICPGISQIRIVKDTATYPHDFTTAIIPAPVPDETWLADYATHSNINGAGDLICISSKTKYPQECMDFVLWYITGGMAPLARGGRIPLWSGFDGEAVAAALLDGAEGVFDKDSIINYMAIEKTRAQNVLNMPKYAQSEITTLFNQAIESVLYGQTDARTAMEQLKADADKLIEAAK